MTSQLHQNIRLMPLASDDEYGVYCYLLMIDDCNILLDCGWDDRFDTAYVDRILEHAPTLNAILLSHSDRACVGALPYLFKRGVKCPVFATVPVKNLGKLVMYDWMNSHHNMQEFAYFNLDDIDNAWKLISSVNYNQRVQLPSRNVVAKPFCSGHSLGGAAWRITKTGEEAIVYAVAFNHRKERHLNSLPYKEFHRAHLLIMDAQNALYNPPRRKLRDEQLVKKIYETVRGGGDVMIVTDTAGRVLETAHFLDQFWQQAGLSTFSLAMMSNVSVSVIEHAKMHIDWMTEKIAKTFEETADNPFKFKHVHLVNRIQDLERLRSPRVVMCSQVDMESGYAHQLFPLFASNERNLIILTERCRAETLGAQVYEFTQSRATTKFPFTIKKRVPLDGDEMEEYRARNKQKMEAEQQLRLQKFHKEQRQYVGFSSSDESEDEQVVADAVEKYSVACQIKNRKRKRARAPHPSVPFFSAKLGPSAPKRENASDDELIEQALKTKPKTRDADTPLLETTFDVFFKHCVLQYYGLHKDDIKKKRRTTNFALFPTEPERKVVITDYGEKFNAELFQERQRNDMFVPAPMQLPDGTQVPSTQKEDDEEGQQGNEFYLLTDEDWPTKCITESVLLDINCQFDFLDFEGRADGEALVQMLEQIKPRTLVLIHGSENEKQHLKDFCKEKNIVEVEVHCPPCGVTVSLGLDMHFIHIEITDELCEKIKFAPLLDGGKMAWIDAKLTTRAAVKKRLPVEMQARYAQQASENSLVADVCPKVLIAGHNTVYMNDVKLTTIRDQVQALSEEATSEEDKFSVELRQGRLVIANAFAMQRLERGHFQMEGTVSEKYYKWRAFCVNKFAKG